MSLHLEKIAPPSGQSFRVLRWENNLREVEELDTEGGWRPVIGAGDQWHLHRELEITLITKGSGTRFVGDNIGRFQAPDLVLLGAHLPHYWLAAAGCSGFAIQFHFPVEHPLWQLGELFPLRRLWTKAARGLRFGGESSEYVGSRLDQLAACSPPARLGTLLCILGELHAITAADRLSGSEFAVEEGSRHQAGVQRLIHHLLSNYAEELPFEELLRISGMSKPTLARQFRRYTGRTVTEFLARVRLDQASQRLLSTDQEISSIAYAVGFNNLSHFHRLFRRAHECSPKGYRQRSR